MQAQGQFLIFPSPTSTIYDVEIFKAKKTNNLEPIYTGKIPLTDPNSINETHYPKPSQASSFVKNSQ